MKKYPLILIIFTTLLCAGTSTGQESYEIRFALLTDPHVNATTEDNPTYYKLLHQSGDILSDAISEVNALNEDNDPANDIDYVLFAGDQTDGYAYETEHFKLFMEKIKELKVPFYIVPGDWDYARDYSPKLIGENYKCPHSNLNENVTFGDAGLPGVRKYDFSLDFKTTDGDLIHLIGVDNALHFNGNRGSYEQSQLDWLEKDLKHNQGKTTVIFQHCPVLIPYSDDANTSPKDVEWIPYDLETELSGKRPFNEFTKNIPMRKDRAADRSVDFLNLMEKYRVPLVCMGDLHLCRKDTYEPVYPKTTLLALNPALVSYPCAYTIYEIDKRYVRWDVKKIEKYSQMSEEYNRRSLEKFNSTLNKIQPDKYTYNIQKSLEVSRGRTEDDPNDWSGSFNYMDDFRFSDIPEIIGD